MEHYGTRLRKISSYVSRFPLLAEPFVGWYMGRSAAERLRVPMRFVRVRAGGDQIAGGCRGTVVKEVDYAHFAAFAIEDYPEKGVGGLRGGPPGVQRVLRLWGPGLAVRVAGALLLAPPVITKSVRCSPPPS